MPNLTENKLISLKEASQISGYAPDYIGQLIRAGKISGKQVYSNITWMTTAEAVLEYKNKNKQKTAKSSFKDKLLYQKRIYGMQFNMVKLILQNFPALKILIGVIIASFITLSFFIFYAAVQPFSKNSNTNILNDETELSF